MPSVKNGDAEVRTFQDLLRVLRERPEWLEELRRLILTEELLRLPQRFGWMEKKVEKMDKDIGGLKQDVGVLKQDVAVLKQDVAVLKEDVAVLKQDVARLKEDVERLKQDVAYLKGSDFERTIRERAPAYLGRLIRRCRTVSFEAVAEWLEDAVDRGVISEEEKNEALLVDLVARGRVRSGREVVLAVEASVKVDVEDVERASKRAEVLRRGLEAEVIGVVIGRERTERAEEKAEELDVVVV